MASRTPFNFRFKESASCRWMLYSMHISVFFSIGVSESFFRFDSILLFLTLFYLSLRPPWVFSHVVLYNFALSPFTKPDIRCICHCRWLIYDPDFVTGPIKQMQLSDFSPRIKMSTFHEMLCSLRMPRWWTETRNSLTQSINFSNCEIVTNARGYTWRPIGAVHSHLFFVCCGLRLPVWK
jgi:hypothetical protein